MRMNYVCAFVRSVISYLLLFICASIGLVPALILLLMPARWRESSRLFYACTYLVYRLTLWCAFLRVTVRGKRNIPKTPAIIVANHQSSLDIPLVGITIGVFPHVWLALGDFFKNRVCRFIMSRVALPIDMSSVQTGTRSLVRAITYIQRRAMHLIIFPEGGRYADGKVHDFYAGFVILAKKTGRPIVPVYIENAYKVYPKGTFVVMRHPLHVTVGEPLYMGVDESDEAFKDRVYAWFKATEESR